MPEPASGTQRREYAGYKRNRGPRPQDASRRPSPSSFSVKSIRSLRR